MRTSWTSRVVDTRVGSKSPDDLDDSLAVVFCLKSRMRIPNDS
jgi:hypothetical protein